MSYQSFLLVVLVLAVSYCVSNAFRVLPTAAGRSMMRARLSTPNTDAAATPVPVPTPIDPANMTLKQRLQSDMKDAMRSKEKVKLAAIRAIQSAIKQKEIDDRIDVDDEMAIGIMSKLVKQRKESIQSYIDANRTDLVAAEQEECDRIIEYMPKQLTEEEVNQFIDEVVAKVGATTVKDMGKVMAEVRPALIGKTDISLVGDLIKKRLGGK